MSVPAERWRRPIRVVEIDEEVVGVYKDKDGTLHYRPTFVLESKDDFDRIRLGYACIKCLEPFERPFPDECPACRFQVCRDQQEWFDAEMKGAYDPVEIVSGESSESTTIDLMERMRRQGVWTPN